MTIEKQIKHNGKTLELVPTSEAREGDFAMISGKLYELVNVIDQMLAVKLKCWNYPLSQADKDEIIQAVYREKKQEVYRWLDLHMDFAHDERQINEKLTEKYGAPDKLKREGVKEFLATIGGQMWRQIEEWASMPMSQFSGHDGHELELLAEHLLYAKKEYNEESEVEG